MRTTQNNRASSARHAPASDRGGSSSASPSSRKSTGERKKSEPRHASSTEKRSSRSSGENSSGRSSGRKSKDEPDAERVRSKRSTVKNDENGFGLGVQRFADKIKNFIKGNRKIASLSSLVKSINSLPGFSAVVEAVSRKKPVRGTALRSEDNTDEAIRITIHRDGKRWFQQDSRKGQGVLLETTAQYMYDNYIKPEMR